MPKEVTAYQADDGSLHTSECAAATVNVELLVKASPLAENQPYAKKLVEWLTGNPRAIREVLEAHERACPRAAVEGTRDEAPEGTRSWREDVIDEHHGRSEANGD